MSRTRDQILRDVQAAHLAWSLKYGDTVAYNADDENPHDGQQTDLSLWQADRSAPPDIDDELNAKLAGLADEFANATD